MDKSCRAHHSSFDNFLMRTGKSAFENGGWGGVKLLLPEVARERCREGILVVVIVVEE